MVLFEGKIIPVHLVNHPTAYICPHKLKGKDWQLKRLYCLQLAHLQKPMVVYPMIYILIHRLQEKGKPKGKPKATSSRKAKRWRWGIPKGLPTRWAK